MQSGVLIRISSRRHGAISGQTNGLWTHSNSQTGAPMCPSQPHNVQCMPSPAVFFDNDCQFVLAAYAYR